MKERMLQESPLSNVTLVLHDIRSVINVGSLFRTADGFGVGKIILSGYTPGPLDRFGRERGDFIKASLGAEGYVRWERVENEKDIIGRAKETQARILVLEQSEQSVDIRNIGSALKKGEPLFLIVGNEVLGVSKYLIEHADACLEIPMCGKKESFNVSVAGAVALYALFSL